MVSKTPRPEKSLKVGDHTLTMTYGMFGEVMRLIGSAEDTVDILLRDPQVRDLIVRRLFTDLQRPIEDFNELINPFEIDIDPLEQDAIVAWVAEHALHFTMSTAQKAQKVVEKYQETLASLNPSKTGSEA